MDSLVEDGAERRGEAHRRTVVLLDHENILSKIGAKDVRPRPSAGGPSQRNPRNNLPLRFHIDTPDR
jgi:hypothetical protein